MNKEVKIKYMTTRHPNKVVFGTWSDWSAWVKFVRKEQNEEGHCVEFLMSYEEKKDCKTVPELKIVNIHPFGTPYTTETWESEENAD